MEKLSQRQLQIGELIKRNLSEIFSKGLVTGENFTDKSFTISEVRISPDLRNATIYIVEFGKFGVQKESIDFLNNNKKKIRMLLNKVIKMKNSPELYFKHDESFDNALRINEILNKVK